MSDLSDATSLLARVYPNGVADVSRFHAAGGIGLLDSGIARKRPSARGRQDRLGNSLSNYTVEAKLIEDKLSFESAPKQSALPKVLTGVAKPFQETNGLKLLSSNLGHLIIKVSAVKPEHQLDQLRLTGDRAGGHLRLEPLIDQQLMGSMLIHQQ